MKVALALSALLAFPLPIMGFVPLLFNNKIKEHSHASGSKAKIATHPWTLFGPKVTSGPGNRVFDGPLRARDVNHGDHDHGRHEHHHEGHHGHGHHHGHNEAHRHGHSEGHRHGHHQEHRHGHSQDHRHGHDQVHDSEHRESHDNRHSSTHHGHHHQTSNHRHSLSRHRHPTKHHRHGHLHPHYHHHHTHHSHPIRPCYILTEKSLCRDLYILAEKADHAAHLVQTSLCRQNLTCWNHIREAIYRLEYGLDLFDKYVDHTTLDKCFTRAEESVVTKCYIHYAQSVIRLLKVTHESGRYLEGEVDRPILTAINSLRAADRAFVLDLGRRIESKESLKVIMRKQGAEDGTTGDSVQEAFNRFISTPLITGEDFKNHPSEAEERAKKVEYYGKGGRKHGGKGHGHGHGRHGQGHGHGHSHGHGHHGHGHGHEQGRGIYRGSTSHGHDGGYTETLSHVRKGKDGYHHTHHHGHHHGQKGGHHHGHDGGHHHGHHGHKEGHHEHHGHKNEHGHGHGHKHGHSHGHQEGQHQGHGEGHGHHHGKHRGHANHHQKRCFFLLQQAMRPLLMFGDKRRPMKPLTPKQEEERIRKHRIHNDVEDTVERWQGSEDMSSPYSFYREKARMERLPPKYRNRGEQYAVDKLREDRGGHGHRDRDSHYDDDKHRGKFDDENIDYFFDELDDGDAPPYPKSEHNGRLHDDYRHQDTPYHHQEQDKFGDRKYG